MTSRRYVVEPIMVWNVVDTTTRQPVTDAYPTRDAAKTEATRRNTFIDTYGPDAVMCDYCGRPYTKCPCGRIDHWDTITCPTCGPYRKEPTS
jgi:hypothetical protein